MRLIGLAAAALALTATAAHAEACKMQGSPGAQAIVLPTGDTRKDVGWGISMPPAVGHEALADLVTRPAGCARAGFVADGVHYDLSGDAGDPLPRLARRADGKGAAFAIVPFQDVSGLLDKEPMREVFGLVAVEGTTARLQRIYDAIPDDVRLAEDVKLSLAGSLPTHAMSKDKQVTIFIQTPPEEADPKIVLKDQCDGPGAKDAQVVLSDRSFYSEGVTHTALASAAITVDKKLSPRKLVDADRKPCTRATFNAAGAAYELRGGGDGVLARYAVTPDFVKPTGYLLRVPSLNDALRWRMMAEKARKKFSAASHVYMLATEGVNGRANVFQFYDKIPDDERLARDMSRVLNGAQPLFALILGTEKIAIIHQAEGAPPAPGEGDSSKITQSEAPDGVVFLSADDGAAVHAATRYACPMKITDYSRTMLMVFDPSDGGRDVACRYTNPIGWFTLYLTRIEPGMDAAEVYQLYELQAKMAAPPMVSLPGMPVLPGAPPLMAFWVDGQAQNQSLQVKRYGDWYVKQRGTSKSASGMITAGVEIFDQANTLFAAP